MTCLVCHKKKAIKHNTYGLLPCKTCQKLRQSPADNREFTTDDIKRQRQEYASDIEQPHYKGALNKRFVEIYGAKAAKQRGFSDKEIKNAKYTYDGTGIRYYKDNA